MLVMPLAYKANVSSALWNQEVFQGRRPDSMKRRPTEFVFKDSKGEPLRRVVDRSTTEDL